MTVTQPTLLGGEGNWSSVGAGRAECAGAPTRLLGRFEGREQSKTPNRNAPTVLSQDRSDNDMTAVEDEPTADTRKLLALMSTGATDRVIARELGVSERTVLRRIARLQVLLGVRSRFQFGLQVAANNWL
jgi:DNA-binding NarL/FixJ family response regulator